MNKQKYYTKNESFEWEQVEENIANDVIRQYVEKRYIGVLVLGSFIIGFLSGVLAHAL